MNRPADETRDGAVLSTVLDRVRPTVVVRRRVYDVPSPATNTLLVARASDPVPGADDEDNGPPSSVNVARALRSLRVDELNRVDQIVRADDETPFPPPAVPTLRIGKTISLADLAQGMSVPQHELVTALVTRGFFDVTVKTVLPRDTARLAAAMFTWRVEEDDRIDVIPTKSPRARAMPVANKPATKKRKVKTPPSKRLATKKGPTKKPATKNGPTKKPARTTSRR